MRKAKERCVPAVARLRARLYAGGMKLLDQHLSERAARDEQERLRVRVRLRDALAELLAAGSRVWIYGSLAKPGRFREWSDIDLALEDENLGMTVYRLMSLLAERTERPVDLVLLSETRLREMIRREGELWTL
jgi:predicted nucleotidyltransferase